MGENKQLNRKNENAEKLHRNSVKKAGKLLDEDGGRVARAAKIGINTVAAGMDAFRAKAQGEFASFKSRADKLEESQNGVKEKVAGLEKKVDGVEGVAARAAGNAVAATESRLKKVEDDGKQLSDILNTEVTLDNGKKLKGLDLLAEAVRTGSLVLQEWFKKQLAAPQNVQEIVVAAVKEELTKLGAALGQEKKVLQAETTEVQEPEADSATRQSEVESNLQELVAIQKERSANGNQDAVQEEPAEMQEPEADSATQKRERGSRDLTDLKKRLGLIPPGANENQKATTEAVPDVSDAQALSVEEAPEIEMVDEEAVLGGKLDELENGLKKAFEKLGYEVPADEEGPQMSLDERADNIDAGMKQLLEGLGYDLSDAEDGDTQKTLAEKVENLEQGLLMINDEIKNRENKGEQ